MLQNLVTAWDIKFQFHHVSCFLTVSLSLSVSEVSRDFGRKQNAHFDIERVYRRSNMGVSLPIWCKSFDNV